MAKRAKAQRPTPLQQRYYRAGLNAGAAMAAEEAQRRLGVALEFFLTRLKLSGVVFSTPLLTARHPMAVWELKASKKRRGR